LTGMCIPRLRLLREPVTRFDLPVALPSAAAPMLFAGTAFDPYGAGRRDGGNGRVAFTSG